MLLMRRRLLLLLLLLPATLSITLAIACR